MVLYDEDPSEIILHTTRKYNSDYKLHDVPILRATNLLLFCL